MIALAFFAAAAVSSSQLATAKEIIAQSVRDPGSLQYRALKGSADGVCGEYNAKNVFGGYTGFQHFMYLKDHKAVYVLPDDGSPVVLLRSGYPPLELPDKDEVENIDQKFEFAKLRARVTFALVDCMG